MGRPRRRKSWWRKTYNQYRREFLQFLVATWGAVASWMLGRYSPAPAPVAVAPPLSTAPTPPGLPIIVFDPAGGTDVALFLRFEERKQAAYLVARMDSGARGGPLMSG